MLLKHFAISCVDASWPTTSIRSKLILPAKDCGFVGTCTQCMPVSIYCQGACRCLPALLDIPACLNSGCEALTDRARGARDTSDGEQAERKAEHADMVEVRGHG